MPSSRILIVEDERQTVDTLRDLFEHYGYETEVALNRNVALNILQERKMDLVILSTTVQDISGTEILNDIRKLNEKLPVIVINKQKSKRTESAFIRAGANVVLIKPLEPVIALKTIKNLLEARYATGAVSKKRKTYQKKKQF